MPISTIPEKWLKQPSNHHTSKWEVAAESSLVRIAPQTGGYERVQEEKVKDGGPKGSRTPDPRHVKAVS